MKSVFLDNELSNTDNYKDSDNAKQIGGAAAVVRAGIKVSKPIANQVMAELANDFVNGQPRPKPRPKASPRPKTSLRKSNENMILIGGAPAKKAGSKKRSGSTKAGSKKAGSKKAGSTKAGSKKAGSKKIPLSTEVKPKAKSRAAPKKKAGSSKMKAEPKPRKKVASKH